MSGRVRSCPSMIAAASLVAPESERYVFPNVPRVASRASRKTHSCHRFEVRRNRWKSDRTVREPESRAISKDRIWFAKS